MECGFHAFTAIKQQQIYFNTIHSQKKTDKLKQNEHFEDIFKHTFFKKIIMNKLQSSTRVLANRKKVLNNSGAGTNIKKTFENVVRKPTAETRRKSSANVKNILGINAVPETKPNSPGSSKIKNSSNQSRTRSVTQSSTRTSAPEKRQIRKLERKNPQPPQFIAKELEEIPLKLKTNLKSGPKKIAIMAPKTISTPRPKTDSTLSPKPVVRRSPITVLKPLQKSGHKRGIENCNADHTKPTSAVKMGFRRKSVTLIKCNLFCLNSIVLF